MVVPLFLGRDLGVIWSGSVLLIGRGRELSFGSFVSGASFSSNVSVICHCFLFLCLVEQRLWRRESNVQ